MIQPQVPVNPSPAVELVVRSPAVASSAERSGSVLLKSSASGQVGRIWDLRPRQLRADERARREDPRDEDMLCGRTKLVESSNHGGGEGCSERGGRPAA